MRLHFLSIEFKMLEMIEMTTEATIAVQKEDISKPGTIFEAIIRITAFITNVKRPRVIMVAGSVRKVSIGLRTAFKIPRTTASIRALRKLLIINPGTR
jgi:hypothetical protein